MCMGDNAFPKGQSLSNRKSSAGMQIFPTSCQGSEIDCPKRIYYCHCF